ncbi:MAG: preprotein translocase subunit SecG [Parcubacteria group bacterium]|nr:preprotein translocase subunit SecG [Parcubacteria group bacterium]
MLQTILNILQVVVAVLLIVSVLLQARGSGLGSVFGGEGNVYRTKRGFEKLLFTSTIVLAVLFFLTAIANVLIKS